MNKIIAVSSSILLMLLVFSFTNSSFQKAKTTPKATENKVINLTEADFAKVTSKGVVLVDFWASWCRPCMMQGPIVEEIANENKDSNLKICKLNVDDNRAIARQFEVSSIPTLIIFKNGKKVEQLVGLSNKELIVSTLKKYK